MHGLILRQNTFKLLMKFLSIMNYFFMYAQIKKSLVRLEENFVIDPIYVLTHAPYALC